MQSQVKDRSYRELPPQEQRLFRSGISEDQERLDQPRPSEDTRRRWEEPIIPTEVMVKSMIPFHGAESAIPRGIPVGSREMGSEARAE